MIIHTQGIVLKSFDFRETSRIATFFTRDRGKIKGILKGIRKDHRKFGSNLDKFSVNDVVYYQSRSSEIHLVSQCDLKAFFFPIRQDLKKTLATTYILELVDAMMPMEESHPEVYELMVNFLTGLETAPDISKLVHIFQIKILLLSGFKPHLDSCLVCGKKITTRARFSSKSGGLICLTCPVQDETTSLVSQGTVASLLFIERNDWTKCLCLGLGEGIRKELKFILNNFLVFHLERRLKSEKFLS